MNSQGEKVFDSLESTLNDLVGSISAYNPSPAAAESLVQADIDLSYYLEDCQFYAFQAHGPYAEAFSLSDTTSTKLSAYPTAT